MRIEGDVMQRMRVRAQEFFSRNYYSAMMFGVVVLSSLMVYGVVRLIGVAIQAARC